MLSLVVVQLALCVIVQIHEPVKTLAYVFERFKDRCLSGHLNANLLSFHNWLRHFDALEIE